MYTRPHDERMIDHQVVVEFAIAVRAPGTFIFVDWSEEDAVVEDIEVSGIPQFITEETTDKVQHTLVGPLLKPRRPARITGE